MSTYAVGRAEPVLDVTSIIRQNFPPFTLVSVGESELPLRQLYLSHAANHDRRMDHSLRVPFAEWIEASGGSN